IQADKQFEWMIYPDRNHGIYGGNTRLHLYKKMTDFIDRTLGDKLVNKDSPSEKVRIRG
ncbi:MAG: S9 family peptidase, partial [Bacteroidia bacterium]|nr:S9 family peptidase [Bacteroidia bacterium]